MKKAPRNIPESQGRSPMNLMSHPSDQDAIAESAEFSGSRDAERVRCLVRARLSMPQPWSFIKRSRQISSNERASVSDPCSRHARASVPMKPRLLHPLHPALAASVPGTLSGGDDAPRCQGTLSPLGPRWYTCEYSRCSIPLGEAFELIHRCSPWMALHHDVSGAVVVSRSTHFEYF